MATPVLTFEEVDIPQSSQEVAKHSTSVVKAYLATLEKDGADKLLLVLVTRDSGGSNVTMAEIGLPVP